MPRRPAMLSEDITVQRMIKERDSDRVILIAQVIPAIYIRRIAESIEYPKATVVWMVEEDDPMTVDCEIGEFYNAWIAARKNTYANQRLSQ
jgi:hypothetical protein